MQMPGFSARAALCLAAVLPAAAAAQSPRIETAPQPTMRNPTAPRPPIQNPEPRQTQPRQREQYTALEFTVWTGGDDLRSLSGANVNLTFPDGTAQSCYIHAPGTDGFDNNSENKTPQCIFSAPKTWAQLRATKMVISMTSMNDVFGYGQTDDNWDVKQVRVIAIDNVDRHYPCLLDAAGSPYLVRLSFDLSKFDLTETENRC